MRIGNNPNNHKKINLNATSHRVIIPVYIPNAEGYFKDSFPVLKVCLESLFATINKDTSVSIISNGSSPEVNHYINELWAEGKIDRAVFNKENVGKMNAIIAETRASFEEFITYSDADVFFDKGWLKNTFEIFKNIPKAGFVSMNPMPGSYGHASSAIIDNFLTLKTKTTAVSNLCQYEDLEHFHKSIGRDSEATKKLFSENVLFLKKEKVQCLIGAGHFCCTIRKTPTLEHVPLEKSYIGVSGGSEAIYLDVPFEKTGLWRVSSTKAYVWHMGNVLEKEWAKNKIDSILGFKEEKFTFFSCQLSPVFLFSNLFPYKLKTKAIGFLKKIKLVK